MTRDLKNKLKELATLRELKGKEDEAQKFAEELIVQAKKEKAYEVEAELNWELHLICQHRAMTQMSKPKEESDQKVIAEGTAKMNEYAVLAQEIIEKHDLKDMKGKAFRFLGRAATFAGNHEQAKDYYQKAIDNLYGENEKSKLECTAFLSEALIRMGRSEEGLQLAKKTYSDFKNSDLGVALKNSDYFVWAVWMSGLAPRSVNALIETEAEFNRDEMLAWLNETREELENPTGEVSWGDHNFQFRIDELNKVASELVVLLLLLTAFVGH